MNALVMYDRETDTLWSQFLSRGVKGPLAGTPLEILPSMQTNWETWSELYPDTLVLDKNGRYFSDDYENYYRSGAAGAIGESNPDDRLSRKDVVIGLVQGESVKAYPFRALSVEKVANDYFAGRNLVVTFDPLSETGGVFDRMVDNRTLSFQTLPPVPGDDGVLQMKDRETGTTWDLLTGRAVSGQLAGTGLERLPSHYSFWFAWSDFHPGTELYGNPPN